MAAGTVPGVDQAMFAKLTQENESLKMRIKDLGILLSSNTIGASSSRRPSASHDAESKADEASYCPLQVPSF